MRVVWLAFAGAVVAWVLAGWAAAEGSEGGGHYAALGVPPTATAVEIRRAYRRLARQVHPDVSGGSAATLAAINAAYFTLRDDQRRAAYDATMRRKTPRPWAWADGGGFDAPTWGGDTPPPWGDETPPWGEGPPPWGDGPPPWEDSAPSKGGGEVPPWGDGPPPWGDGPPPWGDGPPPWETGAPPSGGHGMPRPGKKQPSKRGHKSSQTPERSTGGQGTRSKNKKPFDDGSSDGEKQKTKSPPDTKHDDPPTQEQNREDHRRSPPRSKPSSAAPSRSSSFSVPPLHPVRVFEWELFRAVCLNATVRPTRPCVVMVGRGATEKGAMAAWGGVAGDIPRMNFFAAPAPLNVAHPWGPAAAALRTAAGGDVDVCGEFATLTGRVGEVCIVLIVANDRGVKIAAAMERHRKELRSADDIVAVIGEWQDGARGGWIRIPWSDLP